MTQNLERWYFADSENQPRGPISREELDSFASSGHISAESLVIREGESEWRRYDSLQAATASASSTLPPPPKPPARKADSKRAFTVALILTLFFCAPIGLIWAALSKRLTRVQRIAALSLGLFVFFVSWVPMLVGFYRGFGESSSYATQDSQTGDQPSTSEGKSSESSNIAEMGKRFVLGDFAYEIQMTEWRTSIGADFGRVEPSATGIFLIVHYSIENIGNKTETVLSDDFLVEDSRGRQYRPSSRATTALTMENDQKDWLLSELQPGIAMDTETAFEIPDSISDEKLTLIVREKGILGRKIVKVELR
jgi:hypothetical protein